MQKCFHPHETLKVWLRFSEPYILEHPNAEHVRPSRHKTSQRTLMSHRQMFSCLWNKDPSGHRRMPDGDGEKTTQRYTDVPQKNVFTPVRPRIRGWRSLRQLTWSDPSPHWCPTEECFHSCETITSNLAYKEVRPTWITRKIAHTDVSRKNVFTFVRR